MSDTGREARGAIAAIIVLVGLALCSVSCLTADYFESLPRLGEPGQRSYFPLSMSATAVQLSQDLVGIWQPDAREQPVDDIYHVEASMRRTLFCGPGIVALILLALAAVLMPRPHREIVSCYSCGWRGDLADWQDSGRCPKCGSDKYWTA